MTRSLYLTAVTFISFFLLAACAAQKIPTKETSGFLTDYSGFVEGGEDQLGLVYEKPGLDLKPYQKVMIDHVLVYLNPNSQAQAIQPEQMAELSRYFHQSMIKVLESRYQITDQPGPDVMRIRSAITDVEPGHPVGGTVSSILPIGIAISVVTKATTDTNIGVGRAAMEIELVDSVSGNRLAAAVDRREGGKRPAKGTWVDVQDAFDHWAEKLGMFLDREKAR